MNPPLSKPAPARATAPAAKPFGKPISQSPTAPNIDALLRQSASPPSTPAQATTQP